MAATSVDDWSSDWTRDYHAEQCGQDDQEYHAHPEAAVITLPQLTKPLVVGCRLDLRCDGVAHVCPPWRRFGERILLDLPCLGYVTARQRRDDRSHVGRHVPLTVYSLRGVATRSQVWTRRTTVHGRAGSRRIERLKPMGERPWVSAW